MRGTGRRALGLWQLSALRVSSRRPVPGGRGPGGAEGPPAVSPHVELLQHVVGLGASPTAEAPESPQPLYEMSRTLRKMFALGHKAFHRTTRVSGGSQAPAPESRRAEEQSVNRKQRLEVAGESPRGVGMDVSEPQSEAVCPGAHGRRDSDGDPSRAGTPRHRASQGSRRAPVKDCWVKCAWRTVMGRSGEPVGAQLVGRDPVSLDTARRGGQSHPAIPQGGSRRGSCPQGHTGPCAPHFPRVGARGQAEPVRGCAGARGPGPLSQASICPAVSARPLGHTVQPHPSVRGVSGACVSSCGLLPQRPESRCRRPNCRH